jgi:hypothetical protein
VDAPRVPLHYYHAIEDLEGSTAIRQPTLPRLQIPTRHSFRSSSPSAEVSASTFHSATVAKFHPPPFRGPLSAPEVSGDFRYQYAEPQRMQASNIASGSKTASANPDESRTPRRSDSPPVRGSRRTTSTAVIACRQWCVPCLAFLVPPCPLPSRQPLAQNPLRLDAPALLQLLPALRPVRV